MLAGSADLGWQPEVTAPCVFGPVCQPQHAHLDDSRVQDSKQDYMTLVKAWA